MIATTRRASGDVLVAGIVRGLASEAGPLVAKVEQFAPKAVGLGISREELSGLNDHFVGRASEPLVPLSSAELSEARGLAQYGEVRVPNPSTLALLEWARAAGIPVEPLDPSDEDYAELFTDHISYFELVRRTLRERKLTRSAPAAPSAEEYADRWHGAISGGRGSRAFDKAREAALVASARRLALSHGRIAVVVDRERYAGVLGLLEGTPAPAEGPARAD